MMDNDILNKMQTNYYNEYMTKMDGSEISTEQCKIIFFYVGLDPKAKFYGQIHGICNYKDEKLIFFEWNIHSPNQEYSFETNKIKHLWELEEINDSSGNLLLYNRKEISIVKGTSMSFTEGNENQNTANFTIDLQELLKSVKKWSVAHQLRQELRTTDRQRIAFLNEQNEEYER